jgi:polyisoprenoid-binding protein YceI
LNAVQFPDISFEIKSVSNVKISKKDGDKSEVTATVKGIYSMKGKSKEISVPLKITYIKASEKTAKRAKGDFLSFEGTFDIALKDFDVKGTKDIVGSKVGETIKIEFKLFYNSTN